jgi:hypothetical protein
MAKKVEITLDVKGNVEATTKNLRALKQQLKETAAGSDEFKKIYNQIDDLEDKLKSARGASSDWIDTLEGAGGPLGMVGAGLNKAKVATQSWGAAIKATGIGLLVSLIGGLVAAFASVEGSGKKFEKLIIGFEKIFQGILAALGPVIDALVDLAMRAMPFVTDAFRVAYSAVSSFLQGIGKLGQAVMKLIKGDFAGAWDSAKEAVTGFGKRYDEASANFIKGSNEMTKTEKKNLEDANKAREDALAKKLKQMETEDALDAAKLEKMKAEALALAKTEQEKLDVEKKFSEMSYKMQLKNIEDKQKLYKKDSNEYKDQQATKEKLEAEYIGKVSEFATKQKEINDNKNKEILDAEVKALELKKAEGTIKEGEYQKSLYDIKVKYAKDSKELVDAEIAYQTYLTEQKKKLKEQERAILFQGLQDEIDAIDRANSKRDDDFAQDNIRLEERKVLVQQQRDIELEAAKDDAVKQLEIKKKYADELYNIDQTITNNTKAQAEARTAILMQYADVVGQFGNFLQSVAGKNKGLAKAGLIIEQAAGVAKIIINTQANAAKAGYLSPKGIAELVAGTIGVAAAIAATIKGIRQIDAQDASGGASGGTPPENLGRNYAEGGMINGPRHAAGGVLINAEGGEAVMTRGAVSMFAPMLSMMNQMGGGTSFAGGTLGARPDAPTINNPSVNQQPMIMKTYVVSNELTTEAERQARLKDLSTL